MAQHMDVIGGPYLSCHHMRTFHRHSLEWKARCSELQLDPPMTSSAPHIIICPFPSARAIKRRQHSKLSKLLVNISITSSSRLSNKPQTTSLKPNYTNQIPDNYHQSTATQIIMSSFTQTAARRVATLQIPRTLAQSAPRAAFSTSINLQKTPVESAKDALKTVDRAVSNKIVDGIDVACTFCRPPIPCQHPLATTPQHVFRPSCQAAH